MDAVDYDSDHKPENRCCLTLNAVLFSSYLLVCKVC